VRRPSRRVGDWGGELSWRRRRRRRRRRRCWRASW